MKKLLVLACLVLMNPSFGQQEILFNQLINNPSMTNPAAGGMMQMGEISLGTRLQYVGVEGRPMTSYLNVQSIIKTNRRKKKAVLNELSSIGQTFYSAPQRTIGNKVVAGFTALNDQIGVFSRNQVKANIATHLPITKSLNGGVGIGIGWSNFAIKTDQVKLHDNSDNTYENYISATNVQNYLDANAGLVLYNDRFYFGLSGTQLFGNRVRLSDKNTESKYTRHLYAMASYRMDLGKTYGLEPVLQLKKTSNSPLNWELAARIHYMRYGYMSLSYRLQSAFGVGFGINVFSRFQVAYTFEFGHGATQQFGNTSHEFKLSFIFGHKRNLEKEFKEDKKESEKLENTGNE